MLLQINFCDAWKYENEDLLALYELVESLQKKGHDLGLKVCSDWQLAQLKLD